MLTLRFDSNFNPNKLVVTIFHKVHKIGVTSAQTDVGISKTGRRVSITQVFKDQGFIDLGMMKSD